MATRDEWEDAEPGVRRRILQAQGRLMLIEVQFTAGAAGYEHSHVHAQARQSVAPTMVPSSRRSRHEA
jgi:hypothetical protein